MQYRDNFVKKTQAPSECILTLIMHRHERRDKTTLIKDFGLLFQCGSIYQRKLYIGDVTVMKRG